MGGGAVVLAHGLMGWGGMVAKRLVPPWSYFFRIEAKFRAAGLRVLCPHVASGSPPEIRAAQLLDAINSWPERHKSERVTVVAHSQGGLDARWAISKLDGAGIIRQLVTLSTPHRGTALCDEIAQPLLAAAPPLSRQLARFGLPSERTVRQLSREYMEREFNPNCVDCDDVVYRSFGGRRRMLREYWAPFVPTAAVLRRLEGGGDNDGLVSVASAKWGEFQGAEELDHIEQINFPLKLVNVNEPWGMWRRIIALCEAEGEAG